MLRNQVLSAVLANYRLLLDILCAIWAFARVAVTGRRCSLRRLLSGFCGLHCGRPSNEKQQNADSKSYPSTGRTANSIDATADNYWNRQNLKENARWFR